MHNEDFSTGLDDARMARIQGLLDALEGELDFLRAATQEQRKRLKTVSDARGTLVDTAVEVMRNHQPTLGFGREVADDILRQHADFKRVTGILSRVQFIAKGLEDTSLLLGANVFRSALRVYDLLKIARRRRIPGMEVYLDRMGKFFKRSKRKSVDKPSAAVGHGPVLVDADSGVA
mgnify:CR=1 FL=1